MFPQGLRPAGAVCFAKGVLLESCLTRTFSGLIISVVAPKQHAAGFFLNTFPHVLFLFNTQFLLCSLCHSKQTLLVCLDMSCQQGVRNSAFCIPRWLRNGPRPPPHRPCVSQAPLDWRFGAPSDSSAALSSAQATPVQLFRAPRRLPKDSFERKWLSAAPWGLKTVLKRPGKSACSRTRPQATQSF